MLQMVESSMELCEKLDMVDGSAARGHIFRGHLEGSMGGSEGKDQPLSPPASSALRSWCRRSARPDLERASKEEAQ
eukprot:757822-Hanusia_phi.AAC.1